MNSHGVCVWSESNRSGKSEKNDSTKRAKAKQQNHQPNSQTVQRARCVWIRLCLVVHSFVCLFKRLATVCCYASQQLRMDLWTPITRFYTKIIVRCTVCLSLSISIVFSICAVRLRLPLYFDAPSDSHFYLLTMNFGSASNQFHFYFQWPTKSSSNRSVNWNDFSFVRILEVLIWPRKLSLSISPSPWNSGHVNWDGDGNANGRQIMYTQSTRTVDDFIEHLTMAMTNDKVYNAQLMHDMTVSRWIVASQRF